MAPRNVRATIALLADDEFQASFTTWQAEICDAYDFRPENWDFRPHVSLKLPFNVADLNAMLPFFDGFAASVPQPVLSLPRLALWAVPRVKPAYCTSGWRKRPNCARHTIG